MRRLLKGQFTHWADLRIEPVESYGTDHDIYRLGDHLVARLPRIGWVTKQAALEAEWLPKLAPHLPLALLVPLAMGHPAGYCCNEVASSGTSMRDRWNRSALAAQ